MERTVKEREKNHARAKLHNQRQAKSARTKRARSKARKLRKDEKELKSVTLVAFVWLFSTVCLQMCPQVTYLRGCKITLVASV